MIKVPILEENIINQKEIEDKIIKIEKENKKLERKIYSNLKYLFKSSGFSSFRDEYKGIKQKIAYNKLMLDKLEYLYNKSAFDISMFEVRLQMQSPFSVIQLGNALAKIISNISGTEYVFKKTYVYSIDVDDGEHRFEEKHKDILRKKKFILIQKDYDNSEPLLDFVDEETIFDIYNDGKVYYWGDNRCINNFYSNLKKDGIIIPTPSHRVRVGQYNSEAIINAYLNDEFYPQFYIDSNNYGVHFTDTSTSYRHHNQYKNVIDSFVTTLALVKMNEEKQELSDEEVSIVTDKFISWLGNNDLKDLTWSSEVFNTKKEQNKTLSKKLNN